MAIAISLELVLLVANIAAIYSLLAVGMNMHWGDTGLLNFAQAAFFAVGAYTSAILTTPVETTGLLANRVVGFELPIVVGMVAATALAALAGVLLGATSVRLEGDYLAIVTLAGAEIIRLGISNEAWLTSGQQTLKGIERPLEAAGVLPEALPYGFYYFLFVLVILVASVLLFRRLANGPFGRVLHAIREDEAVPRALGRNTARFKLKSFGLGAAIAGLAGSLWAHYIFALQPSMFTPDLTFSVWAAVIIGGAGSYVGAVAGTTLIVLIRQLTRFIPSDIPLGDDLPFIRLMLIGALLILVLYYRPEGLLGDKERAEAGMEGV